MSNCFAITEAPADVYATKPNGKMTESGMSRQPPHEPWSSSIDLVNIVQVGNAVIPFIGIISIIKEPNSSSECCLSGVFADRFPASLDLWARNIACLPLIS